jgi:hypothetical protein
MERERGVCAACEAGSGNAGTGIVGKPVRVSGVLALVICCPSLACGLDGHDTTAESLRLTVTCEESYVVYEPIYVLVTLTNASEEPQNVVDLGGGWASCLVMDFDIRGPEGGRNRRYTAGLGSRIPYVGGSPRPLTLGPGEETVGEFNITKHSTTIEPGQYSIVGVFRHRTRDGRQTERRSDAVSFTLRKPGTEDMLALAAVALKGRLAGVNMLMDSADDYYYSTLGYEEKYLHIVGELRGSALAKYLAFYLGRYYCVKGEHAKAGQLLETVTGGEPFALTDDSLVLLAKCYRAAGRQAETDKALRRVIDEFEGGNCVGEARTLLRGEVRKDAERSEVDGEGNMPPDQRRTPTGQPDRTEEGTAGAERNDLPSEQGTEK